MEIVKNTWWWIQRKYAAEQCKCIRGIQPFSFLQFWLIFSCLCFLVCYLHNDSLFMLTLVLFYCVTALCNVMCQTKFDEWKRGKIVEIMFVLNATREIVENASLLWRRNWEDEDLTVMAMKMRWWIVCCAWKMKMTP